VKLINNRYNSYLNIKEEDMKDKEIKIDIALTSYLT
jgi:hypothetical protein